MKHTLILYPLFAQVLLTAIMWAWMYSSRISEVTRKRIPVQSLADRRKGEAALKRVAGPSENLINLFEMPVLFYAAVLLIYASGTLTISLLTASWAFVALRYVHSFIHATYNRIVHRFSVYVASTVALWAIWIELTYRLLIQPGI